MKNKEKIILFTCDISGTFSNTKNPENKFDKYKEFGKLMNDLVNDNKYDEIIFSFLTADDRKEFLEDYIKFFNKYVKNDNIKLGLQFFALGELEVLSDGRFITKENYKGVYKEDKIAAYAKDLSDEYDVKDIIFADDFLNPYNIELINHELNCNSINVYGFNPFYK
ncbi:MAG: hypothetical protein ACLR6T_09915, partial [Intestinibacter sp.]